MVPDQGPQHKPPPARSTTPDSGLALPLAFWQDQVAQGRARLASLQSAIEVARRDRPTDGAGTDELIRAYEELAVAEEELRSQNEELLRTHQLLVSERERYHHLFDHAPVPYLVTDEYGVIREGNHTLGVLLRTRRQRLLGKPFAVFIQDASRRRFRSALNALNAHSDTATVSLNIVREGARIVRVEATAAVIRDRAGCLMEIRWLLVDRTRRARAERARRRMNVELARLVAERTAELQHAQYLKDQLLATVSHEFRTGLAAIGGYADLLEMGVRGQLTDVQMADVRSIRSAYSHLATLINDLLDYSRIVAGGANPEAQLDVTDVVLGDALRTVAAMAAPQAASQNVTLTVELGSTAILARADSERLSQILLNLVSNAIKFTPPGGRIAISAQATETDAIVEIVDTGLGIPEEKREEIFKPFARLRASTAPGTGLGLAISRDLARAMGGDITVTNADESGSRFVLRLLRSTRFAVEPDLG